jgi:beta-lactam-binding protein with PASTA domain
VGTTPEAGAEVIEGTEITIVLSIGVEPTALPPLVGLSLSEATARLSDAQLELGEVTYEYSETSEKDAVMSVSDSQGGAVAPNIELEPGVSINLVVSAGALPNVVGLTVEEAEALLSDAGLVGVVGGDGQFSDSIAEGLVIDYVRPQGIQLRPGDTVTLTVSRGPELISIPDDLVGATIQDAVDALEALELRVEVRSEYPETAWDEPFARVTSLEPGEGQQVPKGTLVIIRSFV